MTTSTQPTQPTQTLTKNQKEAVGLLSIGTFLEYFDLMLYVHMAVLLNELFFPKTDPFTASLLSAFAFCSTYLLRPFGALIFGYVGDHIGRKATVVITTLLMACSCAIMGVLPTYAQIGITASWLITICRILQGLSSMGEIVGAEIYLTEMTKPPLQYPVVMMIAIASILGSTFALAIASFSTNFGLNWRIAFWFGAGIALIGAVARTTLKESADFANAKNRVIESLKKKQMNNSTLHNDPIYNGDANKSTLLALLAIQCGWPACFYFTYIYCGDILRNVFHCTSSQIITQNFKVSIVALIGYIFIAVLSRTIHPLKILKAKIVVFIPFALITPYLLTNITHPSELLIIQLFYVLFVLSTNPATPVFYTHIPIFKRFTCGTLIYAISRFVMHFITAFGMVILTKYVQNWAPMLIILPMSILFAFGVRHFIKLEKAAKRYH